MKPNRYPCRRTPCERTTYPQWLKVLQRVLLSVMLVGGMAAGSYGQGTYTWTGGASDDNWQTDGNWDQSSGFPDNVDDIVIFDDQKEAQPFNIPFPTSGKIEIKDDAKVTFEDNVAVAGDIIVEGGVLRMSDNDEHLLVGNIEIKGGVFEPQESTIEFEDGSLLVNGGEYKHESELLVFTENDGQQEDYTIASVADLQIYEMKFNRSDDQVVFEAPSEITLTINNFLNLISTDRGGTFGDPPEPVVLNDVILEYGENGGLIYNENLPETGPEWPSNIPKVIIEDGEVEIDETKTIENSLTLNDGSLSDSGSIEFAEGDGTKLTYGSSTGIGMEWPTTNGPANVTIATGDDITGSESRRIPNTLNFEQSGTLNLGENTLTVEGSVVNSSVEGSGTIDSETTLRLGNQDGDNETQQVQGGTITLKNLEVDKSAGNSDTVFVNNNAGFTFKGDGTLTIENGVLDLESDDVIFSGRSNANLIINEEAELRTGGQNITSFDHYDVSPGSIVYYGDGSDDFPEGIGSIANMGIEKPDGSISFSEDLSIDTLRVESSSVSLDFDENNINIDNLFMPGEDDQSIPEAIAEVDKLELKNKSIRSLNNDLTVKNELNLEKGIIETGDNTLTIGDATSTGDVIRDSGADLSEGFVIGTLRRYLEDTRQGEDIVFPVGNEEDEDEYIYRPAQITFTDLNESGHVSAEFIEGDPGQLDENLVDDDGYEVENVGVNGYWRIEDENIGETFEYDIELNATKFVGVNNPEDLRILRRDDSEADWELTGDHVAGEEEEEDVYVIRRSSIDTFSEFGIGGDEEDPLPVELVKFEITTNGSSYPELIWETETEKENEGFRVERRMQEGEEDWDKIAFVEGNGTTTENQEYKLVDEELDKATVYEYRLIQEDYDGTSETFGPESFTFEEPRRVELDQNYPNPFNPETTIPYQVPEESDVTIEVYNTLGQKVQTLVDDQMSPGTYTVEFDGSNLSSGTYIVRLTSGGEAESMQIQLVK